MRLTVYGGGKVVVTIPKGVGDFAVRRFVSEKTSWIADKISLFSNSKKIDFGRGGNKHYLSHKRDAKKIIEERIRKLNQNLGYAYTAISIRNQKTRWGSCSRGGSLSFNYKIAFIPENIRDYVIVHELCHLKEFNHSKRFWQLVEKIIPDYKDIRNELRKYHINLG